MLRLENLSLRFGAVEAVVDLDLALPIGARFGLIGPNGSGKTSALNLVSGIYPPAAGEIVFNGEALSGRPIERFARAGIARTFQNLRLVPHMTVFENAWLGQHALPGSALVRRRTEGERRRREHVRELLGRVGLAAMAERLAGDLPLPLQRRLELARALAREPKLLLLDEPAGGMTPAETSGMADLIRDLVPPTVTLLLVEHKLDLVAALCERVAVLDFGRKLAEGRPAEVLADPRVVEVYLGRDHAAPA
jgi:branched-chain amino acid transport system ATP-binding protein